MPKQHNMKHRQNMALGPLLALAWIFINPMASTLTPLILYFIFRTKRPDVGTIELRTAGLVFSIQLWLMLISLVFILAISMNLIVTNDVQQIAQNNHKLKRVFIRNSL